MGIKLDWQVEAEQTRIRATEDPAALRRRQQARRQFAVLLLSLAVLVGLAGAVILWRLRQVDEQLRRDLLDTVAVEVAALRLGNYANYMAIQRSASDAFLLEQSQRFEDYQTLKTTHSVSLEGKVVSVTIDDQRARVVLEETIDGIPYHVVWFYWHYEDGAISGQGGWRHVPDDLTFWGDERSLQTDLVRVLYRALDEALAQALLPRLESWWIQGCTALACVSPPPPITVEIVPERPKTVTWAAHDPWLLRVSSPLVGRARADMPLAPELASEIVNQLAIRLVYYATGESVRPFYSDTAWLQGQIAGWLTAQMDGRPADAPAFVRSLIAYYGANAPATLLRALSGQVTLDHALTTLTGTTLPLLSVEQLNALDWREFFQWRLALEPQLLAQPNGSGAFLTLYDLQNTSASSEASRRLEDPAYAAQVVPQVVTVIIGRDETSQTYAYVETTRTENGVTIPGGTVIWRLAEGTWKRVN
jgi:Tfp pilus assembly protein PilN